MLRQYLNILLITIYAGLPVCLNEYLNRPCDYVFAAVATGTLICPFVLFPALSGLYALLLGIFLYLPLWADVCHLLIYQAPLNSSSLTGLLYTNPQEAVEFIKNFMHGPILTITLFTLVWIIAAVICISRTAPYRSPFIARGLAWSVLAVSALHLWASYIFIEDRFIPLRIFLNVKQLLQNDRELQKLRQEQKDYDFAPITSLLPNNEKQTYVIIIGESLHRRHMQLYGYNRPTTPRLSARKDLLAFNNVTAPHAATLPSLKEALSFADSFEATPEETKGSIIKYFNTADFTTFWLSNQYLGGLLDNQIALWGNEAAFTRFINHDYWGEHAAPFDQALLPLFKEALQNPAPKKLIILHLMGSHIQYKQRYPKNFAYFSAPTASAQEVAEYDNSVLYNDAVISAFLSELEKQTGIAALLYISDHGQDIEDTPGSCHCHTPEKTTPPMLEIPFILWLSPEYKQKRPDLAARAAAALNKTYNTRDFIHTVIDLAGLSNRDFQTGKSIFSSDF